ncbi:MAG: hypothetical protein IKE27_07740 [Oscillospiraceae bacterium]|nr:hypothetical protein [Oscillospiraceae bacterium]
MARCRYKRIVTVMLAALICALILTPVFAEQDLTGLQGTGSEKDLYGYFEVNGWPESVSYVYADDNMTLEIGMIDVSDEAVNEILSLVDTSFSVNIVQCDFSHSYLVETRDEIIERFTDYGIKDVELAERDDKVNVVIPGDRYQAFMAMYQSLYGSAVDYYPEGEVTTMADAMGGMGATMIMMCILIVVFIMITMFVKRVKAEKDRERKLRLIQEQRFEEMNRANRK